MVGVEGEIRATRVGSEARGGRGVLGYAHLLPTYSRQPRSDNACLNPDADVSVISLLVIAGESSRAGESARTLCQYAALGARESWEQGSFAIPAPSMPCQQECPRTNVDSGGNASEKP